MALDLQFASSAEPLARVLIDDLAKLWRRDPFAAPTLIVPNPAVKKWLLLEISRSLGASLGLQITTLERSIWQWMQVPTNVHRLDGTTFALAISHIIRHTDLQEDLFLPVREYLNRNDSKRIEQLAHFLSQLFLEYEFNRPSVWDEQNKRWALPGMDQSWLQNKTYDFGRELSPLAQQSEAWQSEIYRRALALLQNSTETWVSLPHWHRHFVEQGGRISMGQTYLFLVSKISHWHRNFLVDASQLPGNELHVFLTNPCAEFWEDVDTQRNHWRRKWNSQIAQSSNADLAGIGVRSREDYQREEFAKDFFAQDPRLLELWGHSAKENIALWCPLANWDFTYHQAPNEDAPAKHSLSALQKSLLLRRSQMDAGIVADKSLQLWNAPHMGREVEEIRNQILDALRNGVIQRLEDVVVYATDMEQYLPFIHQHFGAHSRQSLQAVPAQILGAPGGSSLYAQAIRAWIHILQGRYDRASLFALFRNPVWQANQKLTPSDVEVWEHWAEETCMIRGYDANHRTQLGDQGDAASDLHTIGLGLYRLLIGNLAAGEVDLGFLGAVPGYRDFDTSDTSALEHFAQVIEELRGLSIQNFDMPLSQAFAQIRAQIQKEFAVVPEGPEWNTLAEERVRDTLWQDLQQQAKMAELFPAMTNKDDLLIQLESLLPSEINASSKAWIGGVTFAPLRMGMVVSHPMVCVMGLGAKEFPGQRQNSLLDLLTVARKVGDSHPVRDNQLAFLEVIHAAHERLVLTYCGRNLQKQEDLQPSSVLLELQDFFLQHGISLERKLPLRPWESVNDFHSWNPRHGVISEALQTTRAMHRFPIEDITANILEQNPIIDVNDLHKFLKNPLEYRLSKVLHLRQDEDANPMDVTDEPLEASSLDISIWEKSLLIDFWAEVYSDSPLPIADWQPWLQRETHKRFRIFAVQGGVPLSPFANALQQSLLDFADRLIAITKSLIGTYSNHRLVQAQDLSLGMPLRSASLELPNGTIQGKIPLALVPRQGVGHIGIVSIEKKLSKASLNHWLQGVVVSLLHEDTVESIQLVQVSRTENSFQISSMKKATESLQESKKKYLEGMLQELQSGVADHLPASLISKKIRKEKDYPVCFYQELNRDELMEELEGDYSPYHCYLPAWDVIEAKLPAQEAIPVRAELRYGPYLEEQYHDNP